MLFFMYCALAKPSIVSTLSVEITSGAVFIWWKVWESKRPEQPEKIDNEGNVETLMLSPLNLLSCRSAR